MNATVGATLFDRHRLRVRAPVSLSESVADADTVELFGPSAKVHWNEPLPLLKVSVPTFDPVPAA